MKDDYSSKPDGYYGGERPDIVRLIPVGTTSLLDVGCGEGGTALAAKKLLNLSYVAGIEFFEEAAGRAREILDNVVQANIEQIELPYPDNTFDCIICADVLEHLIDPWSALRKLHRVLSANGVLIASIPNIAHLRVVKKIIHDRFEYEPFGILDQTHLRFFTLHTIRRMFSDCGYEIIRIDRNINLNFFMKYAHVWSFGYIKEANTFQFLVTVKKV